MSSRKTGIALSLAGVIALSASTPSMASMPAAIVAIETAPSTEIVDVRWGWWPGIGVGIELGLLGAAIAAPYYGYGYPSGYPYGYASYYGYGYPMPMANLTDTMRGRTGDGATSHYAWGWRRGAYYR
jgi:hypothetical protein